MSAVAQVLELEVGLRGVSSVMRGLEMLSAKFRAVEGAVTALATKLKGIGPLILGVIGTVTAGVRAAMGEEEVMAKLRAFTGSLEAAHAVMKQIQETSYLGVFPQAEIEKAAMTMERMERGSFARNIELLKNLGATVEGGIEQAADLIAKLEGGSTQRLMAALIQAGIGPDKLRAAGLNVEGNKLVDSAERIKEVLSQLPELKGRFDIMSETTLSKWQAFKNMFEDLLEIIGEAGIKPLKAAIDALRKVMPAVMAFFSLVSRVSMFYYSVIEAIFGGVWRFITMIADLIQTTLKRFGIDIGGGKAPANTTPTTSKPAERPNRRDDYENMYDRYGGRAWSG